jgi:predicted transposase YdaD
MRASEDRPDHDGSYQDLFSHPELVADLLRGFVKEPWLKQADLSTLEPYKAGFLGGRRRRRQGDAVWRLRWGKDWLYVYLFLEFQSSIDRFMALRMLVYVGLLWQDLHKTKQLTPGGRLPPVLPLVLYNGEPRWTAPVDVAELVEPMPGGLERYRPSMRYVAIDEGTYGEVDLAPLRNLAAALFRLENSRGPQDVERVVAALMEWLSTDEHRALRRAFVRWLQEVLLRSRMPDLDVPKVKELEEVQAMLAHRVVEWTEQWKQEGHQQGFQEGHLKGRQEGRQEGESRVVRKLLQSRFGALPEWVEHRLAAAGTEDLERWAERVLTAESLEQVLGR